MRNTILTWKKRTSKKRRLVVLRIIKEIYPDAVDTGDGVAFFTQKIDTRPIWIFFHCKDLTGIRHLKKKPKQ